MGLLAVIWQIFIFALGCLQVWAAHDGFEYWFGGYPIVATILSLCIGFMPIIGGTVGIIGAVEVWGWSWTSAIILFWGLGLLVIIFTISAGGIIYIKKWFKK
jgi:hypothetical protein